MNLALTHKTTVASAPTVISEPEFRSGLYLQRGVSTSVDHRYLSLQGHKREEAIGKQPLHSVIPANDGCSNWGNQRQIADDRATEAKGRFGAGRSQIAIIGSCLKPAVTTRAMRKSEPKKTRPKARF